MSASFRMMQSPRIVVTPQVERSSSRWPAVSCSSGRRVLTHVQLEDYPIRRGLRDESAGTRPFARPARSVRNSCRDVEFLLHGFLFFCSCEVTDLSTRDGRDLRWGSSARNSLRPARSTRLDSLCRLTIKL